MKKKVLVLMVLSLTLLPFNLFAQDIEKLTFTERRSDGFVIGAVTVNAIYSGLTQQKISLENNFQVIQQRLQNLVNNNWTDWELLERSPARALTLTQIYDAVIKDYNMYPRGAIRINYYGLQFVRIYKIPNGRSSPFWWSDDGKSFNIMFEFWMIMP